MTDRCEHGEREAAETEVFDECTATLEKLRRWGVIATYRLEVMLPSGRAVRWERESEAYRAMKKCLVVWSEQVHAHKPEG